MKKFFKSIGDWISKALGVEDSSGLGDYFADVVGNWAKKYGETGLTDREKESTDYQVAAQDMLNEQEYDRKVDFYERFESPEARVRQYKEAGLNPMLLSGNGASVSASGGVGAAGAASAPASSPESGLAGIIGTIMQVKNFQLQKRSIESEILKRETETSANRIENKYRERANELRLKAQEQEIALKKSQEVINLQTLEKLSYDTEFARIYAAYAPELFDVQIAQGNSTAELNNANAELSRVEAELSRSRKREIESIVNKNNVEAEVFRKQLGLISAQIRNYGSLTELNEQAKNESIQRVKNMVEEAKLLGKKIGLTDKEIEWYAANHTEVVDVNNDHTVQTVTFKDNKGTYTVAADGKVIYNRPYKTNVNAKGKRTN